MISSVYSLDQAQKVIIKRQTHQQHNKYDPELLSPQHHSVGKRSPQEAFHGEIDQVAAIQHRNRQQIDYPQTDAENSQECQKLREAKARGLARVSRD